MTTVMSPSESVVVTLGQIAKITDLIAAALRKSSLPSAETQQIIESQGGVIADECVASIRRRVEAISNMIVRRVHVNRGQTPKQVIDATGRVKYVNADILATMPRGEGEEKEVFFFKLNRWISDDDLAKEYELRGLVPDLYAQAQVNTDDPSFADEHLNGCHWQDADGRWNYAAFCRWNGERSVFMSRGGRDWDGGWWFGGVRK